MARLAVGIEVLLGNNRTRKSWWWWLMTPLNLDFDLSKGFARILQGTYSQIGKKIWVYLYHTSVLYRPTDRQRVVSKLFPSSPIYSLFGCIFQHISFMWTIVRPNIFSPHTHTHTRSLRHCSLAIPLPPHGIYILWFSTISPLIKFADETKLSQTFYLFIFYT